MAYRSNEPYNDLPLLPPPTSIESPRVMRQCITASRALAELKGTGNLIPNQSILINSIPLREAQLSSEIENIVTTQDALFRAAVEEPGRLDPATREVLRYRTALKYGSDKMPGRKLNIDLMIELCSILLDKLVELRDQEPILIEDKNAASAVYTPPRGRSLIVSLLRNLEAFIQEPAGFDPLIKMAIYHYQFEAIHPFVDGNGRTGRILNLLILLQGGLLQLPVLYLSRHIIQNKQEYYRLLRRVTEQGDWESWLVFMLTAVEQTALWTTGRIHAIRCLLDQTAERCRADLPERVYSRELIELTFVQPYIRIQAVIDAGLAKRETASGYLRELERIGILDREKRGREVIYRHHALMEILKA